MTAQERRKLKILIQIASNPFAGCIGYTGGNQWSMNSKFENVHVRHIQIKSSATPSQNLGGLVGWIGSGGGSAGINRAPLDTAHIYIVAQFFHEREVRGGL